jgi:hypothetical protein
MFAATLRAFTISRSMTCRSSVVIAVELRLIWTGSASRIPAICRPTPREHDLEHGYRRQLTAALGVDHGDAIGLLTRQARALRRELQVAVRSAAGGLFTEARAVRGNPLGQLSAARQDPLCEHVAHRLLRDAHKSPEGLLRGWLIKVNDHRTTPLDCQQN